MPRKILLLLAIGIIVITMLVLDVQGLFQLSMVRSLQEEVQLQYQQSPLLVVVLFMLIYIVSTSLSIPGAVILTCSAGAFFGFWVGALVASFSSTLGAVVAFSIARYLLYDAVQSKYVRLLKTVNAGIKREGNFYLFATRLSPIFPYFLANILFALTPISLRNFFWVSQIAMLPLTLVYVYAGNELATVERMEDILSLQMLIGLTVLALFPLVAKWFVSSYRRYRQYVSFKKPKAFDYNVVVIGGGAAGLVAANVARGLKAKVALVEQHRMGGDCLYTGCVPSKSLIKAAKIASLQHRAADFGFSDIQTRFTFSELMANIHAMIKKIEPHDSPERYQRLGVDCIRGTGKVLDPFRVAVSGRILTTRSLIIATGAKPKIPAIPGIENIQVLTSDTLWELTALPAQLLILGGGPIGCELAQAFSRLGSQVSLVERNDRLLAREDEEASDVVAKQLVADGVSLFLGSQASQFESHGKQHQLHIHGSMGSQTLAFSHCLVAIGREVDLSCLEGSDVVLQQKHHGQLQANGFLRTNYPNIYCCGDVTGPYQFTHAASNQAIKAAINALFRGWIQLNVHETLMPRVTFVDPEVAHVGLTEQQAQREKQRYEVTMTDLSGQDRAITEREKGGFIKVLTVPNKDKILGVTIVGPQAGETIGEFVLAMQHGIGLNQLLSVIHPYPTFSEAVRMVATTWKKAHQPKTILGLLERFHGRQRGHVAK